MEAKVCFVYRPHRFNSKFGIPFVSLNSSVKLARSSKLGWLRELGFRTSPCVFASNSMSKGQSHGSSSTVQRQIDEDSSGSVSPLYVPTPPNRELRTPHSGYHFDGSARKFFEGWYFKVSIPERRQSFCIIYTVENPVFRKKLTPFEEAQYGPRFTGVGAQILGADDKYICQYSQESQYFWGSRHELVLGNTFVAEKELKPPNKEVPPQEFDKRVLEGFQVSPLWNQGFICDDGRSNYVDTVKTARWEYSTRPIYGWGNVGSKQKSTAGWLAAFPVFEPHWQICMASGLSTGRYSMNVNRDSDDTFPNVCLTDSSEDDLATEDLETLAFLVRAGREAQQQLRQPQHNIGLRGHQYILEVLNGNPINCRELFRLEVDAFRALCSLLRSNSFLKDTRKGLTVEEQIGMFTSVVAAGDEQRIVGQRFQHSTETVNAHVRNVMKALCRLGTHLIYPSHTSGVHPTIAANPRNYPWFEGCIGAIDGTMIDAVVPTEVREAYRNRHGKVAQNVLCVCDLDMKFTFLYTGWEGSSHDARVFIDALSQGRNAFPMPLDGHYYLVDSAYPCTRGFMPPYPRERYHRSDRQGQRGFRGYKDYFNHRHSCIRNVIERTFGVLKSRFRILRLMPGYKVGRQGDLIIACCTLHNFIRMTSPNDWLFEEWRDMELSPSGRAYSDAAVSGNHPDMTVESARAMAAIRDDIAKRMWEARSGH